MESVEQIKQQAYAHFADGELMAALVKLRQAEKLQGLDAELANDQAVVLYKLGQMPEALAMFRRAADMEGHSLVAANTLELLAEQVARVEELKHAQVAPVIQPQPASPFEAIGRQALSSALTAWQDNSASALHKAANALTDDAWANVLYESVQGKPFGEHLLPGFISEETQRIFVGSSGVPALREGHQFIQVVLDYMRQHGRPFDQHTKAIDFGSGWGRYTRFMLKYVHPDNLYGLEVNGKMVEHCRKAFGMANFIKVDTFPPSDLRDGLVDLIFGYSVFSHLAPHCANAWIAEFARITRPGALVMMTTQGRSFIEYCRKIRASGDRSHPWYISLAKAFADPEKAYRDYDAGEFLHYGEGQYDGTYGESLISRGFIEKNWLDAFELVDFVDDRSFLPQALFVLKRNDRPVQA